MLFVPVNCFLKMGYQPIGRAKLNMAPNFKPWLATGKKKGTGYTGSRAVKCLAHTQQLKGQF